MKSCCWPCQASTEWWSVAPWRAQPLHVIQGQPGFCAESERADDDHCSVTGSWRTFFLPPPCSWKSCDREGDYVGFCCYFSHLFTSAVPFSKTKNVLLLNLLHCLRCLIHISSTRKTDWHLLHGHPWVETFLHACIVQIAPFTKQIGWVRHSYKD